MFRRALLFLAAALAAAAAQAQDIAHVARPGDTPVRLSKTYHVSVAAILARNKGLDPCRIKVGDVILVPRPGEETPPGASDAMLPAKPPTAPAAAPVPLPDEEPAGVRYVVIPGDNPAAIAERFGIALETLSRVNPDLDPKKLAVGRVLSIPQNEACPPPPVPVSRPGEQTAGAPLATDFQ
ncbi:LysM domain-containing protein [Solidesulfovibrio sp.]|uniref:LysM peptidoglycan-binding domain-containing protein n=1 Tax=Solidesulfovibrio sp. TaxID=2910990 RepID=UPI002B20903F|nr:LysM domain-containing protein [Solidesulfovibrio sp.]MEA5090782.1 LysM domain-containing protein [Solidesulfovibrio sp.]HML62919.1 LysM domain-containing protein [Solidesulfovibrio sp.]